MWRVTILVVTSISAEGIAIAKVMSCVQSQAMLPHLQDVGLCAADVIPAVLGCVRSCCLWIAAGVVSDVCSLDTRSEMDAKVRRVLSSWLAASPWDCHGHVGALHFTAGSDPLVGTANLFTLFYSILVPCRALPLASNKDQLPSGDSHVSDFSGESRILSPARP